MQRRDAARALQRALPAWALLPACPALNCHITAFPGLWSPGELCPPFPEGFLPCGRFSKPFCREELIFHNKWLAVGSVFQAVVESSLWDEFIQQVLGSLY